MSWNYPSFNIESSTSQELVQSLVNKNNWPFTLYHVPTTPVKVTLLVILCSFFLFGRYLCYSVPLNALHFVTPVLLPLPTPVHPDHPLKGILVVLIDSIILYYFSSCLFGCFSTVPYILVISLIHSQILFISHYISALFNIIASSHMWLLNLNLI